MTEDKKTLVIVDADGLIYSSSYKSETAAEAIEKCKQSLYNIYSRTKADYVIGFLTSSSHRYKVATTKEYKGNRKLLEKPKYFKMLFEYLKVDHNFILLQDTEADDLCISTHEFFKDTYNCIISSPDKDLRQIKATFYNPRTYRMEYISQEQADYNFYYQMLVGDTGDNIVGIPGIGKAKAPVILEKSTNKDYFEVVLEAYVAYYKNPTLAYYHFSENYLLLYLRRNLEFEKTLNPLDQELINDYLSNLKDGESGREHSSEETFEVSAGSTSSEKREF